MVDVTKKMKDENFKIINKLNDLNKRLLELSMLHCLKNKIKTKFGPIFLLIYMNLDTLMSLDDAIVIELFFKSI